MEAGPLTRIAQARSDLSPAGRGENGVQSLPLIPFHRNGKGFSPQSPRNRRVGPDYPPGFFAQGLIRHPFRHLTEEKAVIDRKGR